MADIDLESMADMAKTFVRTPLRPAELERLRAALLPLLADLDRLRALPLKDCEPPLIFRAIEE